MEKIELFKKVAMVFDVFTYDDNTCKFIDSNGNVIPQSTIEEIKSIEIQEIKSDQAIRDIVLYAIKEPEEFIKEEESKIKINFENKNSFEKIKEREQARIKKESAK